MSSSIHRGYIKYFLLLPPLGILLMAQRVRSQDSTGAKIEFSGFVDAYYSKNFAEPISRTNKLRNFDVAEDQFNLSLAELVVQKKAAPVGFRFDLDFGSTNDLVQPGNGSTLSVLQQGYLSAVLPVGNGLTLDAGKFVTHMGYEAIESKDNWNYSRSFLFAYAVPYYHTGIRLTYPVSGAFTAALHIVNGWNSGVDNNKWKSLGLMLNYSINSSTSLILNVMDGIEESEPVIAGKKIVFDFIVTQQLTEALSLSLNADYGNELTLSGMALWKGAALYGKYTLGAKSAIAIRAEVYYDPIGYTTGVPFPKATFKETTVTYDYRPFDQLIVRGEFRDDFSNNGLFDKKTSAGTQTSQGTLLVGIVALF